MTATNARKNQATKARTHETRTPRKRRKAKKTLYDSPTGAVLFAKGLEQVAVFYASVLGLREASRDGDHILLESPGFQLVVHRIPEHAAASVTPSRPRERRASASFKPVFFVQSLARVRARAKSLGGFMEPSDKEWTFNGAVVCDAVDPEGNVVQFRESRA